MGGVEARTGLHKGHSLSMQRLEYSVGQAKDSHHHIWQANSLDENPRACCQTEALTEGKISSKQMLRQVDF